MVVACDVRWNKVYHYVLKVSFSLCSRVLNEKNPILAILVSFNLVMLQSATGSNSADVFRFDNARCTEVSYHMSVENCCNWDSFLI